MVYLWNNSLKRLVDERTLALETIKNELQITFDGMKTYLVVIDHKGQIKNMNAAFLQYLNKKYDWAYNRFYQDIPILGILNLDTENFSQTYDTHQKDFSWYDGNIYEIDMYPLQPEGETSQLLVILEDRTNERLEEQKMIHANKMAAIGQLASGVAHELRNPLGVIRNSSFILNDLQALDIEDQTTALKAIDNSVNRANKIIDNLLKFSRLSDDKEEWADVKELIKDIGHFFNKEFYEHKIRLDIDCDEGCKFQLNTEAFRHIMINLMTNAVDAMPGGGILTVSCHKERGGLKISVRDTGIGIASDIQEKIFDPFFTTKAVGKGTGLGLYIVYSQAEKIDGGISVDSQKGIGTTFTLSIKQRSMTDE